MNLIIGNVHGFFSNFIKILTWLLIKRDTDRIIISFCNIQFERTSTNSDIIVDRTGDLYNIYPNKQNIWTCLFDEISEFDTSQNYLFTLEWPEMEIINLYKEFELIRKYDGNISGKHDIYHDPNMRDIFKLFNSVYKKYIHHKSNLQTLLQKEIDTVYRPGKKTLAVHIRAPFHHGYFDQKDYDVFVKFWIEAIQKQISKYDGIVIFTQIEQFYNNLKDIFPDKIIDISRRRNTEFKDWAQMLYTDSEFYEENMYSYIDAYLMSRADFLIAGTSNMLGGALIINPNLEFEIPSDIFKTPVT